MLKIELYKDYLCREKINCLCATCSNYDCREERRLTICTRCKGKEKKSKQICVDYKKGE